MAGNGKSSKIKAFLTISRWLHQRDNQELRHIIDLLEKLVEQNDQILRVLKMYRDGLVDPNEVCTCRMHDKLVDDW